MGKHLVLVGGGHAHLTVLLKVARFVRRGHRVTLVGPSAYHYYSGMGPGMLSGIYSARQVRFNVKKMVEARGAVFIEDSVIKINPAQKTLELQTSGTVDYDIVSFNTGSNVPLKSIAPSSAEKVVPVKPVFNLLQARRWIVSKLKEKELNFIVIGGGPAGLEVTANLWRLIKDNQGRATITLVAGNKLLADLPEKVRVHALASLNSRGIEVIEGKYAEKLDEGKLLLSDTSSLPFDLSFAALGVHPSSLFGDSEIPVGTDGGLLVNPCLQSVGHPELFGGGDCISFADRPLDKVGVYAVRQNPILLHNLLAALEGRELQTFTPQKNYMLIFNMGNGRGILWKKNFVWEGRLAFRLKDYIDRKFMKRFQVSGEMDEDE